MTHTLRAVLSAYTGMTLAPFSEVIRVFQEFDPMINDTGMHYMRNSVTFRIWMRSRFETATEYADRVGFPTQSNWVRWLDTAERELGSAA